jgi:hypothetical protein
MPNEEVELPDNSALYEGPIKLAGAEAKRNLPAQETTRNSYDVDPNLDFQNRIERSRERALAAHGPKVFDHDKYEFQEYPKYVIKDVDGKPHSGIVASKEEEDAFHAGKTAALNMTPGAVKSPHHDIHGNEVTKPALVPVPAQAVLPEPAAPIEPVIEPEAIA